jgi:hypothetical protein
VCVDHRVIRWLVLVHLFTSLVGGGLG